MKKKVLLASILAFILIPFTVFAASTPRIITLEATSEGKTVKYNGTIEEGSHAVMCKLYDKDSNEVDLLSSAVDNKAFEGTLTAPSAGDYTVSCANYEGGDIKETKVTVTEDSNPKTLDKGVRGSVIAIGVCIIVAGVVIVIKSRKK